MKTMAARIHQKRLENNLTMEQLGEKLGVGKSTINKWEKARVEDIKRPYINKMAEIFRCDPAWLMGLDPSLFLPLQTASSRARGNLTNAFTSLIRIHQILDVNRSLFR